MAGKAAAALTPAPDATDHVDIEDGQSAGASTEPEAPDTAAPEAPVVDAALLEEAAPAAPVKTASEQARDDIYARVRERRAAEVAEAQTDPQVKILDTFAGGEPPAVPASHTTVEPPAAAEGQPPAAAAPAATDGGAPPARGVKITVYGQETEVPEDKVYEAGVRALQKEHAAEYRLAEAVKQEQKLTKYHRDLDAYKASLEAMERDLRAGKTPDAKDVATATAPPTTGVLSDEVNEKIAAGAKAVAEAVYKGDAAVTAKVLQDALTSVAQGRTATPPPVDVNAVADAAAERLEQRQETKTTEQKRQEVNQTFATEFKAVTTNQDAMEMAMSVFNRLLTAEGETRPWTELAREAGEKVLFRFPELRAAGEQRPDPPPTTDATDTLSARRLLKSKTVPRMSTATARATPPAPPTVPSNRDYIAQMRANRGLPPG